MLAERLEDHKPIGSGPENSRPYRKPYARRERAQVVVGQVELSG